MTTLKISDRRKAKAWALFAAGALAQTGNHVTASETADRTLKEFLDRFESTRSSQPANECRNCQGDDTPLVYGWCLHCWRFGWKAIGTFLGSAAGAEMLHRLYSLVVR